MIAVEVKDLCKAYDKQTALSQISFQAKRGEIFGIIGPDGAGKTTLFRILTTLLLADSGQAKIDGLDVIHDYKAIRKRIGYMPGRFSLYEDLTIEENLEFFATLFHTTVRENYYLIEDIYKQIEPFKNRRAGKLSGGMKQKLALSCALIHKPSVLFLDEPTTGVDPVSRKEFWEMLSKLKAQGITILVSTPYMDEASLCDRIAFIHQGEFLDIDTPENMIAKFSSKLLAISASQMYPLLLDLRANPQVLSSFTFGDSHHVTIDAAYEVEDLERYIKSKGHTEVKIHPINPTIEDCFMQITTTDYE